MKNLKSVKEYQRKAKESNSNKLALAQKAAKAKYAAKMKSKIDETERIKRFNYAKIFGLIFICSCCSRRLYENGVTLITEDFKEEVNRKKEDFYNYCIRNEIKVEIQ